jgi:hypothetical protein
LPVISASQVVLYRQNNAGGWAPGAPLPLHEEQTQWSIERGGWSMGATPSRNLTIRRTFLATPAEDLEKKAEAEAVARISKEDLERVDDLDINGDGREDLVLWRLTGDLEPRTDIFVFLRGANNRLPERPTQVLHCRGFPVQVGHQPKVGPASERLSPVCDLARDGRCELVLGTIKTTVISSSGIVDMLLSGSLTWALTIRTFNHGLFSPDPDTAVPFTAMVPMELAMSELFLIDGDFNGDGRPDLLVKQAATQWAVILSSARGWFGRKPAASFEVPLEGNFVIQDLNGDGLSDLVVQAWEQPTLFIFLSQSNTGKRPDKVTK